MYTAFSTQHTLRQNVKTSKLNTIRAQFLFFDSMQSNHCLARVFVDSPSGSDQVETSILRAYG
jgi:hypothetical protein